VIGATTRPSPFIRLTSSACGRTPGKLQVARVRLPALGSNVSDGDVQGPGLENWLEEDNVFGSPRAIGANFDRDRQRSQFSPYGRASLRLNSAARLDD
jgi:hypothetical protein